MFKKIMSKLRGAIAPSPEKNAPKKSAGSPDFKSHRHPALDRAQRAAGSRPQRSRHDRQHGQQNQPRQNKSGDSRGKTMGDMGGMGEMGGMGTRNQRDQSNNQHRPHSLQRGDRGRGGRGGRSQNPRHSADASRPAHPARERGPVYEPPLRSDAPRQLAPVPPQDTPFSRLGLNDHIAFAVAEKGYVEPTPIQTQAIPLVLSGRDVTGSAQTGTGKTAAFALPILQRLGSHGRLRCLVLEPTRELALQVEEAFGEYSKHTDLDTTIVYGGVGYERQRADLRRGVDILVATPGRLLDHMEQGDVRLDSIEILVLDEVDRMLDMGFLPDVKRIVQKCPEARQTLFFTATLPPEIARLASWALRDPVEVKVGTQRSPADTISHAFYPVVAAQKSDLLDELLKRTEYHSVIIFTRTKFGADRVARRLEKLGLKPGVLHSDRNQRERTEALAGFKEGKYEILVATNIAARGLDIADVSHVINYDVPENPEDYVHRIGRTGRAQKTGEAFTLVTEEDVRDARSIERFINATVERKKIDGFNYIYSALFDEAAQAAALPPKTTSVLRRGR